MIIIVSITSIITIILVLVVHLPLPSTRLCRSKLLHVGQCHDVSEELEF